MKKQGAERALHRPQLLHIIRFRLWRKLIHYAPRPLPKKASLFGVPRCATMFLREAPRIESRKSISRKQTKKHNTTWCGAVGSAGGLGACDRLMSRPPKAREFSVFLAFSRFSAAVFFGKKLLTTDLTTYGFDRKIEYFHQSGCGAAGSARSLGVPWRYPGRGKSKRRKSLQHGR